MKIRFNDDKVNWRNKCSDKITRNYTVLTIQKAEFI